MNRSIRNDQGSQSRRDTRRGGAVIVVVLALMAMLAFLGLFFYDFVQIEQHTAENFARTTGELEGIDPESLFNLGAGQVIGNPDDDANGRGSVMGGGKLSILAHILGTMKKPGTVYVPHDYEIRNGRGIKVIQTTPPQFIYTGNDATPNPAVGAGTPTASAALVLNRSAAANGGTVLADTANSFEPDVGYTYPDLNALFLSAEYLQQESDLDNDGVVDPGEDLNGDGDFNDLVRIVKPSFMDPAIFNALQNNTAQWYNNSATAQWILRPHLSHVIPGTSTPRFLDGSFPKINSGSPTALKLGPWTTNGDDYSGLDVDADNDGIPDAIYLDLGLPPVTLDDGARTLIPLTFWKIADLNGLIDLNSAGNIAEFLLKNRTGTIDLANDVYNYQVSGVARPIHFSHYGATPSEVNPMWALFSDPSSANAAQLRWDVAFYRSTSTGTFTRLQLQNTELAMLLLGSSTSMGQSVASGHNFTDNLDDLQGRFGDSSLIPSTTTGNFSAPGNRATDEDVSEDTNGNGVLDSGEDANGNGVLDGYLLPRGVHPTDSFGTGAIPISTAAAGARQLAQINGTGIPYPSYTGRWQQQPVFTNTYQTLTPAALGLPSGLVDAIADQRPDDTGEVNRYSYTNIERDNLFRPYEIASLHLSDYDFTRSSLFSRVRQLAPYNFNMTAYSGDIRRQFTTESWDRREFSFAYNPNRNFEFNDIDGSDRRFPPAFAGSASRHETGTIVDLDPFRPEVRRLLTTKSIRTSPAPVRNRIYFPQLPLELNRILDDQPTATPTSPAFDSLGNPNFRQLTPHVNFRGLGTPVGPLAAMIHGNDTSAAAATHPVKQFSNRMSDPLIQEWWARYDRQRLARDIYVLLATLCTSGVDPTSQTIDNLTPGTAREMAQFAVNYVDSFDEDDTITRFEYDDNLTDGWNPTGSLYVNGVEAQKLSIGETLWVKQQKSPSDVNYTYHDESDGHHQFLYLELRNCTPFTVDFQPETWRIARINPTAVSPTMDATDPANHIASFVFKSTTKTAAPGANFVIASHDGNLKNKNGVMTASDIYADVDTGDATHEVVVPSTAPAEIDPAVATPPTPLCDLDLCHAADAAEFTMTPVIAPTLTATNLNPKMLYFDTTTADTETRMVISLQRRRNLWTGGNLSSLPQTDWIEVDRIDINPINGGNDFLLSGDADVATKFPNVRSTERYHHFDDRDNLAVQPATPRATLMNHSIGRPGSVTINTIADASQGGTDMSGVYNSVWQPHHDRDLTSAYELVTVPVCAPDNLISRMRDHNKGVSSIGAVNGWANFSTFLPYAAITRFAPQQITSPTPTPDPIPWTRLLNFLALPDSTDRVQRVLNPTFVRSRTFGRVNINTVRTPPVFEGLIDDPQLIQSNSSFLTDNIDSTRTWWNWLKGARDGSLYMGGQSSRPFTPPGEHHTGLAGTETALNGVEHGLLRHSTTYPPATNTPLFGLLEARAAGDLTNDYVDLHTRHRILQKIANNTTNRSHMFAIWGGVDFFEGTASGSNYQVGAKAADVQTCRWFLVVDMSRLEEAYDTGTQSFDWRKFVIYRQRLE